MISVEHKFLFIGIQKTACSSILTALQPYYEKECFWIVNRDGEGDIINRICPKLEKHSTLSMYKEVLDKDLYDSLYKFCSVRNPWERTISYYFYAMKMPGNYKITPKSKEWDRTLFIELFYKYFAPHTVRYYTNTSIDNPIASEMNYIIRYENLREDFKKATKELDIKTRALPWVNKSKHDNYRKYYDSELELLIYNTFKEEADFFGYAF